MEFIVSLPSACSMFSSVGEVKIGAAPARSWFSLPRAASLSRLSGRSDFCGYFRQFARRTGIVADRVSTDEALLELA